MACCNVLANRSESPGCCETLRRESSTRQTRFRGYSLLAQNFNQGRYLVRCIAFFIPEGQLHDGGALSESNILVSEYNLLR